MSGTPGHPDRILIRSIRCRARIGVSVQERREFQMLEVDVALETPLHKAGASDDIADAVDYVDVVRLVCAEVESVPTALLESLAERLCRRVLEATTVVQVSIIVRKFPADLADRIESVAVELTRQR